MKFSRFIVLLYGALAAVPGLSAEDPAAALVGTWKLVAAEYRAPDGRVVASPFGDEPQGMLMYDANGNMAVQLLRKERQPFASPDRLRGSDREVRAALESYMAYYGKYVVDVQAGTVTHHVTHSMFPNWSGSPQKRYFKLESDRITLSTPPYPLAGTQVSGVLVWERVK